MTKRSGIILVVTSFLTVSLGAWVYTDSFNSFFYKFLKPPRPYNVIMISIDTLRADHLGTYGYSRNTSPNLDRFAQDSIVFEQAITQGLWSIPSHISLFTSQYPSVHGVLSFSAPLDDSKITLAETLKQQGYATAAFVAGGALMAQFINPQGFDVYKDNAEKPGVSSLTDTIPLAVEWIKQNKNDRFFLFVHTYDAHAPYHNPEPFEHMFDPDYDGTLSDHERFYLGISSRDPRSILDDIREVNGKPFLVLEKENIPLNQNDIDHIIAHYDGGIRYTDTLIQQFLDTLKEMDLYENSIIIIISDHGETIGDTLQRSDLYRERLIGHGIPYEEVIHVPLFIKHPAFPAQRISTQAQIIDIFPTLLDFLNIPFSEQIQREIQGQSLVPLIKGKAEEHFNEYVYGGSGYFGGLNFVRTTQWKLAQWREDFALYNLQDDPKETRNVIEQYPDIADKLKKKLSEWSLGNLKKQSQ